MSTLMPTAAQKRFDSNYYVEGFATTFNDPYCLYEYDGVKYYEVIDRGALAGADVSDVIMQLDHAGEVFARNKMGNGKPQTLLIEPQEHGLFMAADLGGIDGARKLYDSIDKGYIYKMSWAFTIGAQAYDKDTHTRTILRIKKVYDVSAVTYPANPETEISARSYFNGVIEMEKQELLKREAELLKLKLKLGVSI